ncbi:MAG: ComF family protein [Candidatus Omnitrophica bacterium]|nr:ComF family protein [Candidatus Omnitrophota bacterium]
MLQDVLQGIKELIFPDNCFLCRKYLRSYHQKQLCPACLSLLPLNLPPFCLKCSRHLTLFNDHGLCLSCLKNDYSFDRAFSACIYVDPLPQLLHAFKYHDKTALRKTFSELMINYIETYHIPLENFDLILPIPLHPVRLRERGFNQAELLSRLLTKHYDLPQRTDILRRHKLTPSQTTMEAKQRWTNVHDAFRIDHSSSIADKSILIVDDLLTTAATANAASEALKNAGAAYVGVFSLAITP